MNPYDFDKALTHLYFPALRTTAGSTVQSYKDWFPMTLDVRCDADAQQSTMYPVPVERRKNKIVVPIET